MITVRCSVKKDVAERLPDLLKAALRWMRKRYPDVNFVNTDYIFSAGFNRSRYFRNSDNSKYIVPTICICTRATLYMYKKPSLGMKRTMCRVGYDAQIMCSLIHELTHHVQYETGIRKDNELDTTKNELEYLKEHYNHYYTKITT